MNIMRVSVWDNGQQAAEHGLIVFDVSHEQLEGQIEAQRLRFDLPTDVPYGWHVKLIVMARGSQQFDFDITLAQDVDVTLPVAVPVPSCLTVQGDHFLLSGEPWIWKGSTDFRLLKHVLDGHDILPLIQDRKDAGANLVRVLAMKADNTGWELSPRVPGYWSAVEDMFDLLGAAGLYCEWTIFADTKRMMANPNEQQEFWAQTCEAARQAPHVLVELLNEDKHATQAINAQKFSKPDVLLSSHGSGLSDKQPVQPFWDFATYHARRTPAPPSPKPFTNYNAYQFRDADPWPLPCPFIPEESVKPQQYGFDPAYARMLGMHACCVAGGTFHGDWWNEPRLFTPEERACAMAFYGALED